MPKKPKLSPSPTAIPTEEIGRIEMELQVGGYPICNTCSIRDANSPPPKPRPPEPPPTFCEPTPGGALSWFGVVMHKPIPSDGRVCSGYYTPWASPALVPILLDKLQSASGLASWAARLVAQQGKQPGHSPLIISTARILSALVWAVRLGDLTFLGSIERLSTRYLNQHAGGCLPHQTVCAGGYRYFRVENPLPARTEQLRALRENVLFSLECGRSARPRNRLQSPDDIASSFVMGLFNLDGGELDALVAAAGKLPLADEQGGGSFFARSEQQDAWNKKVALAFRAELAKVEALQGEDAIPTLKTATKLVWKGLEVLGVAGARHLFSFEDKVDDA